MPAGAEALRYEAPLVQVNNSVSDDLLIRSMFNESTQQDVDGEQILQGIIQDAPSCLRACAIAPDCVAAVFRVWRKVPSCNLYRTVRRLLTVFKTTLYTKKRHGNGTACARERAHQAGAECELRDVRVCSS